MKTRSQRCMYLEPMHHLLMSRVLDLAGDLIDRAKGDVEKIIDVGCAEGMYLDLLPSDKVKVGIDVSLPRIEVGRREEKNAMFVLGDAESMPFRSGAFDLALCIEVLEHVKNPGYVVNEIHRILRPGGESIISVPLGDAKDPTHIHIFFPTKLRNLLDRYGFIIKRESTKDRVKVNIRIALREYIKRFIPDFVKKILPRFLPDFTSWIYFPFILVMCRKCFQVEK